MPEPALICKAMLLFKQNYTLEQSFAVDSAKLEIHIFIFPPIRVLQHCQFDSYLCDKEERESTSVNVIATQECQLSIIFFFAHYYYTDGVTAAVQAPEPKE